MKLRSLLFVPADSERKFAKATGIGADALILDLEDSVAPGRKALARGAVKELLGDRARNWSFLVRINPFGTGLTLEDLAAVVRPGLDGILIPKVNGIEDVDLISHYVDVLEVATGVAPGHVKLLVVATETPAAMIGFNGYARKNKRLVAMTWGGEDLSAALGALPVLKTTPAPPATYGMILPVSLRLTMSAPVVNNCGACCWLITVATDVTVEATEETESARSSAGVKLARAASISARAVFVKARLPGL